MTEPGEQSGNKEQDKTQVVLEKILKHLNPNPELMNDCFVATADIVVSCRAAGLFAEPYMAEDVNLIRGITEQNTSYHTFSIVGDEDMSYLVDTTFKQFVDPTTGRIKLDEENKYSRVKPDNPIIVELLEKGYAPLTDEILNIYMDALTDSEQPQTPLAVETMLSLGYGIEDEEDRLTELKKFYNFDPATIKP